MEKKNILLIGYDSNLCLGVIYCLNPLNYNLYLLTGNPKNAAKYSRHVKEVECYKQTDNLLEKISSIVKKKAVDLIMPVDEMETRFVRQHNAALSSLAVCSWTTELATFDIGINKGLLAEFLTSHDIPCPQSLTAASVAELESAANKLGFPVLVKPTRNSFGRGIQRFETWDALKTFYEANSLENQFILQPFIAGSDITCNVICKEGKILCHTIQESPVKYGSDFSSNDVLEFHDDDQVLKIVSQMISLLNWSGVACVDLRRNNKDRSVYILEINGRFWASTVSSYLKAGINFPMIMTKLALGENVEFPKQRTSKQLSIKTYFREKIAGRKVSFSDTKYQSYWSDPMARFVQVFNL